MTTFAKKFRAEFNWRDALQNPQMYGGDSLLAERSRSWITCAVGNQCDIIPRIQSITSPGFGAPIDTQLRYLGVLFHNQILLQMYKQALETLEKIELRSAFLISTTLRNTPPTVLMLMPPPPKNIPTPIPPGFYYRPKTGQLIPKDLVLA